MRPVDRLRHAGGLGEVEPAQAVHEGRRLESELLRDSGNPQPDDLDLALEARVPDPVEEAATLERVVQLARPVGGEDDGGPPLGVDRADLGNRDLEVGENLEQERLELLVGAVDLVDQEYHGLLALDRLEQRAADQELAPEQLLLGDGALLRGANAQELAQVVPLVHGVGDVQALVALEPDQAGAERAGEGLAGLGLANPCLTLEQDRLLQSEGEEEGRREATVGQVARVVEGDLQLVDGRKAHEREPSDGPKAPASEAPAPRRVG